LFDNVKSSPTTSPSSSAAERRDNADADFYSATMQIFINRFNNKERARNVYAFAVLGLVVYFVVVISVVIWSLAQKSLDEHVGTFIGAIAGLLSTIFGLPLFIMKFLFDKKEDAAFMEQMMDMLKKMRDADVAERLAKASKDAIEISEIDLDDFDE